MKEPTVRTLEEARRDLDRRGMSIAEFARQHGLNYWITCQVLRGLRKGKRGESHRAAVLLGLKEGVIGNMLP
ncbi:DNA-binding protein [Xylella taiwanensis]|uniref:DNA-binding protein n=1 Tax=Xylella taiwanensis TaxID=1444770 RepID=Z9JHA7_9GAMM|nr:hypothetical protein [Xylella taiwanensis]EWS77524.1 hypothetical protein AF72_10145 [Xylella taiwanensis]MCD8455857.1 DNA-binding protein [Xylella taiwanensis]MCD8458261.1 DNA-binding protein [Xylella taiwanensis]MCD8460398.1 DNA-binding protein [Xylella taiwanensis]MCD8463543.1 DNA-binding protein [Xylella taiwanensis]